MNADFVERTPGWDQLTRREQVEGVNRSGPHDLIGERREDRRPWTESGIRKPLERVEEELAMRREIGNEPIVLAPNRAWEPGRIGWAGDKAVAVADAFTRAEDLPIADACKDHPCFGNF
ncbi:MAG: hypothetical protein R3D85_02790 [Paracoccaceae bacterium]